MAKRKPLPYAAAQLIDDALMANAEAQRALRTVVDKQTTQPELYRLLAKAVIELNKSSAALKEARNIEP